MESNNRYVLAYDGNKLGELVICKQRDNGCWGIHVDIDHEKLPEENYTQMKGIIAGRPEVIALKDAVKKLFNDHNNVIAVYEVIPCNRPEIIRILKAADFKTGFPFPTLDGYFVRVEYVDPDRVPR